MIAAWIEATTCPKIPTLYRKQDLSTGLSYPHSEFMFNIPKPDAQIEPGGVDIEARIYKPDIQYQRGGVDVYMIQKPGIRFQVANLDVRV
ncbi:MAG TPA: DUF6470 family protein [Paenibacillus sp.]|uniref:DUF6470 family protein n=1 Tax=Paenibacillus sp. TaxID=58172 RepID=UPI002C6F2564|nr:DUF6470 family protein [Paenibacillus sp.]HUC91984.1 DUF6470 family protein [Paenibacillus sp.]